jgi:hypothetical protein
MAWFNKKPRIDPPMASEEDIQNEIRKRILKEARKREGIHESRDTTEATLDALEDIVSLSREEMEKIAEEVKEDFEKARHPDPRSGKGGSSFVWIALSLIILSYFGARRGSPWMLVVGIVLVGILVNRLVKMIRNDKDESP